MASHVIKGVVIVSTITFKRAFIEKDIIIKTIDKILSNVFVVILELELCSWGNFSQRVEEEGDPLWSKSLTNPMTVNDVTLCQAECNMNRDIGCKSITYCPSNRLCYQYSKEITKNDENIKFYDCFTSYYACSGKFLITETSE